MLCSDGFMYVVDSPVYGTDVVLYVLEFMLSSVGPFSCVTSLFLEYVLSESTVVLTCALVGSMSFCVEEAVMVRVLYWSLTMEEPVLKIEFKLFHQTIPQSILL